MRFSQKLPGVWGRKAGQDTGEWPLLKVAANEWLTICPACLEKIRFEVGKDYRQTNQDGAPSFEPMILCKDPECDGALLIVHGEVYTRIFPKKSRPVEDAPEKLEPAEDVKLALLRKIGLVGRS
jgi:hypothetical protein